jgi:hypothetical protein
MSVLGELGCLGCGKPVRVSDRDIGGVVSCSRCAFRMSVTRDTSGDVTLHPCGPEGASRASKRRLPLAIPVASVAFSLVCLCAVLLLCGQNRALRRKLEAVSPELTTGASGGGEAPRHLTRETAPPEAGEKPRMEGHGARAPNGRPANGGDRADLRPPGGGGDAEGQCTETASLPSRLASEAPDPAEPLACGGTYTTDSFSFEIASVRVACPMVRDMLGDMRQGKSPQLAFTFRIANLQDRRILRYQAPNAFLGGHFTLTDDVDNVIRPVGYGMGANPVGALTGKEDIGPGQTVTHVEVFSVPPRKTKYLILYANMAAFGGSEVVRYRIVPEDIRGFRGL